MKDYSISVIIPAYNVEDFILKAIDSASIQVEVKEVIVVDDGSTDATVNKITEAQKHNPKLFLYQHPKAENKGRSASRNLGISKATTDFIAFLDADDYYLQHRFKRDIELFKDDREVDGVYNAIGAEFYRGVSEQEKKERALTTTTVPIPSDELFDAWLSGEKGYFSIIGLTIKKGLLEKTGLFSEKLKVAEDTELVFRLTMIGNLKAGNIKEPVAKRGIHDSNVFNKRTAYKDAEILMCQELLLWMNKYKIDKRKADLILGRLWYKKYLKKKSLLYYIGYWANLFFKIKRYLFSYLSLKYFPLILQRQKYFPFLYKGQ